MHLSRYLGCGLLVVLDNGDVAHNINPDICFLTKGQVAKNLKQSKDSALVWINSLWNFYWDNQFIEKVWKFFSNFT